MAQTGKLAGKVTDEDTGSALEGVSVFLEGTEIGTYTQSKGNYIITDIPVGEYKVYVSMMGYEQNSQSVTINNDITTIANFTMKRSAVKIEGISVSANRAVKRETPIAFTDVDEEEISDKYTTQDVPQLLDDVPGLFANTTGLGDAEITMRGFEADKIQVLINGIPVNDPESQKVYWSNWTGLSANVKSIQVQKGAGSSLYGSGAFGGSLNIETMGSTPDREITVRSSYGSYYTDGDVADGKGEITDYNPFNYNVLVRYNSGNLYGGKFNYSLMFERKRGDYYLTGTDYDGYSFGLEAQNIIGNHTINTSFIGAPQEHNQVYFKSDPKLMERLGRNYNRNNHEYQKNYYFKPQISIRDEWKISENQVMMTNVFATKGNGGGKYLNQDKFDVNTGEISYRDWFWEDDDPAGYEWDEFSQHALYLYKEYGVICEGFNPQDTVWIGTIPIVGATYLDENGEPKLVSGNGSNFYDYRYDYSWRNNSISDHVQFGANTYYQYQINPQINMVLGGEIRHWMADHYRKRENFRHLGDIIGYEVDPTTGDSTAVYDVEIYDEVDRQYDETTYVTNLSGFARFTFKPIEKMNVMIDGQLASYNSRVKENPIEIYDLGTGEPTGSFYYSTKNTLLTDPNTGQVVIDSLTNEPVKKFSSDDYKKTYNFFSPKFGINYNLTEYINLMANYSISYKEPKTTQWYSSYDGPDGNQRYLQHLVDENNNEYVEETFYGELKPEKINTIEFGLGYEGVNWNVNANYYISDYKDKIESVTIPVQQYYYNSQNDSIEVVDSDESLTLNAGQARHQGFEFSASGRKDNIDTSVSMTISKNRWTKMNVEEIFGGDAEDMIGKVVPYSPEQMYNFSVGYTLENMPLDGKIRIGFTGKYWDGYYANYENEYVANYVWNGSDYVPEEEYYYHEGGDYILNDDGEYVQVAAGEGSYDVRTKMASSKLPAFVEFGTNLKYSFKLGNLDAFVRLDINNILNKKDNYLSGRVASDYNRGMYTENGEFINDYLTGNRFLYVTPSPLINMFLTMEVRF
jgi:outer membrane receptor for ferrienterochelin and colicin